MQIAHLGPAWFFIAVIFVMIPRAIVFENLSELGAAQSYLMFSAIASVVVLGFAIANERFLSARKSRGIARVLFGIALFAFVSQLATPLAMDNLETGTETPFMPTSQIVLDVVILGVVIGLARVLAMELLNNLSQVVGLLLLASELIIGFGAWPSKDESPQSVEAERPEATTQFAGNVYHFIFDSFGGNWWNPVVEGLGRQDEFKDFIEFANTRSNYMSTVMSIPSFTTGSHFNGEGSLAQWLGDAADASALARAREQGFVTTAYSIRAASGNARAHYNHIEVPVSESLVADIWLLRIVPTFLRSAVFSGGEGLITAMRIWPGSRPWGDTRCYRSLRQFEQIEQEESARGSRGEFVFAHIYFPHSPYQLMRDGRYSRWDSNRLEQSYLTVNVMARFIEQLKREGKYDESLIIVQSDHGVGGRPPAEIAERDSVVRMSAEVGTKIAETDVGGREGDYVEYKSHALLLVKPPHAEHVKTRRIDQLAQLIDVHPLIIKSISSPSDRDLEALAIGTMATQQVVLSNGYRQKDAPDGSRVHFGSKFTQGFMSRYRIDASGSWSVDPRIAVAW